MGRRAEINQGMRKPGLDFLEPVRALTREAHGSDSFGRMHRSCCDVSDKFPVGLGVVLCRDLVTEIPTIALLYKTEPLFILGPMLLALSSIGVK